MLEYQDTVLVWKLRHNYFFHVFSWLLLEAFVELWKATIIFVMSVHLPIRMEQLDCHWTDFDEIRYLSFSRKICWEYSNFIKIQKEQRILYMQMFLRLWQYLSEFFLEWEIYQIKVVDKFKAHILYSVTFFLFKNRAFHEIISKNMVEPERLQLAIWRRVAWWINKATRSQAHAWARIPPPPPTHTEICKTFFFPHCHTGFVNAPVCYVTRTLPVLYSNYCYWYNDYATSWTTWG